MRNSAEFDAPAAMGRMAAEDVASAAMCFGFRSAHQDNPPAMTNIHIAVATADAMRQGGRDAGRIGASGVAASSSVAAISRGDDCGAGGAGVTAASASFCHLNSAL